MWRWVATGVGFMIVALGVITLSATAVHDRLLEPTLYTDALTERQVYRRLYAEVLTAPEVRAVAGHVLDELELDAEQQRDVLSVATAVLRFTFPPEVLNDLVGQMLEQVFSYIRGDVDQLDVDLFLLEAFERTDEVAALIVRRALANATTLVAANLDEYEHEARSFLADLAGGRVPAAVPLAATTGSAESLLGAIDDASVEPLPGDVREKVALAIKSGEGREALIDAGVEALRRHLDDFAASLAAGGQLRVDLLDVVEAASPRARDDIVERVATVRAVLGWVPPWMGPLGAAAVIVGTATLFFLHRRRLASALLLAGGALVFSGVLTWLLSTLVAHRMRSPIEVAAEDRRLSPSLRDLLLDVDDAIRASLRGTVAAHVRTVVVVGIGLAVAAIAIGLWRRARRHGRRPAAALLAASLVAAAATMTVILRHEDAAPRERACNGHVELCDRAYDEVVQAAAHNAMASPGIVRIWPEHDADIRAQLDYGVRALLVDASYWEPVERPEDLISTDQPVAPDVAAALFDTLGSRLHGHPGAYLCHSRCALGAVPFATALRSIKRFLDVNPDEVVTIIIQDAIAPADTENAFEDAGLLDEVYDGSPADRWPTLGELIDRGQRVVVFSEQHGPPPPWLRTAFTAIQDTPYQNSSPAEFSCRRLRGPPDASLFLLNHWVRRAAPDRADAAVVNTRQFIVERARRCAVERGQLPDFIAVDFFSIGDVIGAVDELNGVD